MARGESPAVAFARLEPRGVAGGTEDFDAGRVQRIGHAGGQRTLGSDQDEVDLLVAAKRKHLRCIARIDIAAVGGPAVARRDHDRVAIALQRAGHGVFASARAEHEDPHARANSKVSFGAAPETSTGYFPVKQAVQ